ncbi:MAG TPA: MaoC family dehydratase [Acidobacteriota bacterium]|jgi:acyl dehydratase
MLTIESLSKLGDYLDQEVAVSDWIDVSQEQINQFARATGDDQWIHTDPKRAASESPFGTTIAHGFLTLSLLTELAKNALWIEGVRMGINYGLNRVRFIAPVRAGSRMRGRFSLGAVEDVKGGVQATWDVTVEVEGSKRPCCVVQWLVRYYQ